MAPCVHLGPHLYLSRPLSVFGASLGGPPLRARALQPRGASSGSEIRSSLSASIADTVSMYRQKAYVKKRRGASVSHCGDRCGSQKLLNTNVLMPRVVPAERTIFRNVYWSRHATSCEHVGYTRLCQQDCRVCFMAHASCCLDVSFERAHASTIMLRGRGY